MMRTHNKQPEARVEPERYIVKVDKIAQNQKKIKDFLHWKESKLMGILKGGQGEPKHAW